MAAVEDYDYLFKIVMVGDSGVGKSNLLTRFATNSFTVDSKSTIGVEFATKKLKVENDKIVKAQIWDTAGQERYRSLTVAYYRGAVGAVIVYDVTRRFTFENAHGWLTELREQTNDEGVFMLIGNKCDMAIKREVSTEEGNEYAAKNNIFFRETSAMDNVDVQLAFEEIVRGIYSHRRKLHLIPSSKTNNPSSVYGPPQKLRNDNSSSGKASSRKCCR